jgi:hypothetical protein
MKRTAYISGLIASTMLFTGCATIFDGKTQEITFNSIDEKKVVMNGQAYLSPGTYKVKRPEKDGTIIQVEGCNQPYSIDKKINNTFWLNILSGGFLGSTTDGVTGAMWEYETSDIDVNCQQ